MTTKQLHRQLQRLRGKLAAFERAANAAADARWDENNAALGVREAAAVLAAEFTEAAPTAQLFKSVSAIPWIDSGDAVSRRDALLELAEILGARHGR